MSWRSHGFDNASLVAALLRNDVLHSETVANAMRAVDRCALSLRSQARAAASQRGTVVRVMLERSQQGKGADRSGSCRGHYVPRAQLADAYIDAPQPIGFNQTISAPHMHATCAELLEAQLQAGNTALDVGSGSGYLSAVFAKMVGPTGRVVGVELVPQLVSRSQETLERDPATSAMFKAGRLTIHQADAHAGWKADAPYDAIHVGAAAAAVPPALVEQLANGGRMVIPVGRPGHPQVLMRVDKDAEGRVTERPLMGVQYVPLVREEL